MEYNCFNVNIGHEIKGNGNLEEILEEFGKLYITDSFFTLVNDKKEILQFMLEKNDGWVADIPEMEKNRALQKHVEYSQCITLIEDFYNGISIDTSDFDILPL
ncbi:hypothetical protein [Methanobrevibacter filiformis]|uniref:Uncharacterized protein n=1 Tax=Methanobrevibacter filiformis TaxID=55758 RepID=A0A165ZWE9_9EURY|nr:hypothetical protein [Methanobrevibacter filiformis]KZX11254.1 hypothetical protein MBFIL_14920 [Methanobrevibacter filiformis]